MLTEPLPWYIAGPLIGLVVPALLLLGGKVFGLSANLRHVCAALPAPSRLKPRFVRYEWWAVGGWNLAFAVGIGVGGWIAFSLLGAGDASPAISAATAESLREIGVDPAGGFVPAELFSWSALVTPVGALMIVGGGFLIGFGARWAGGCTSGHAISGLADFQLPSLVAVVGFFAGGLVVTHLLLPLFLS
jgi:uncharacterized membrane protein YedE/YeeE